MGSPESEVPVQGVLRILMVDGAQVSVEESEAVMNASVMNASPASQSDVEAVNSRVVVAGVDPLAHRPMLQVTIESARAIENARAGLAVAKEAVA